MATNLSKLAGKVDFACFCTPMSKNVMILYGDVTRYYYFSCIKKNLATSQYLEGAQKFPKIATNPSKLQKSWILLCFCNAIIESSMFLHSDVKL